MSFVIWQNSKKNEFNHCTFRETFFLFLVTPRVSVRPIFGKKNFCRLSIGEKIAIQYHIQYC